MSSTTATASAPKPVENTAKPAQGQARAPRDKTEGEDMFANLLSLLASTQMLPEPVTLTSAAPADATSNDTKTPDGKDNPFAALLGWGLPATGKDAPGRTAGTEAAGLTAAADRATSTASEGKIDISDMTPVEPTPLETTPKGQVALPANAVSAGRAATPACAPMFAGTAWRGPMIATACWGFVAVRRHLSWISMQ